MADFLPDLWTSIFTPGPTPSLLVATNATFAALQVLLLALLVATYSVHFVVLSVLCAGLWGSINWFARELLSAEELQKAKKEEKREGEARKRGGGKGEWKRRGEVGDSDDGGADDEGEETEVEGRDGTQDEDGGRVGREIREAMGSEGGKVVMGSSASTTGSEQRLVVGGGGAEARQRVRVEDVDRSGDISSTDSEWERVSQEGDQ